MSLLLYAVGTRNLKVIKYLLDSGYNVNYYNSYSEIPLIYAVYYNFEEVVDLLLTYNPDIELRCKKFGTNALETAIYRNKPNLIEVLVRKGAKFSFESYCNSSNNYF